MVWMLRNYDEVDPLILSGMSSTLGFRMIYDLDSRQVPEEQEVSIDFVVTSVLRAFQQNRERQRISNPSLPPFNVKTEVRILSSTRFNISDGSS